VAIAALQLTGTNVTKIFQQHRRRALTVSPEEQERWPPQGGLPRSGRRRRS
jgi:hypothetical protein